MTEREEFDALLPQYKECVSVYKGGCACTGGCLGNKLALLRKKYDHEHPTIGDRKWWSDQGHCGLLIREGDSGRTGAPLTAENYWTGAK